MDNKEAQKNKIRQRYKGIDFNEISVIPAIPEENLFDQNQSKRVGVYVRVSTDDVHQTSSYELQKNHYTDFVQRHPNWELVKIYADEGISGTSVKNRQAFAEMISDCMSGKIDIVVAKSVSRFARNILDCIGYIRKLAEHQPPIGIFFESENIYTLNKNAEMALAIIAIVAQEESHNKSEIMNASIEMRFRRGIFLTPPLLGYDQDEDGNLIINEGEASIVRLIFFMYLYGYTCTQIAETLTQLVCKTKKGNFVWSPNSVLNILQNERYYGAVLARKTWTPNYLDHKSKKNKQNRNKYFRENNHEAIISRDDFIAVQHFINNVKYGNKRILPELKVIEQGVLSGFVTIHPSWAGFTANDYICASDSIPIDDLAKNDFEIKLSDGEFDFRGYEIARSQFFNTTGKIFMSISIKNIFFSSGCIHKLDNIQYIEMLILPQKRLFAVRPSNKTKNLSIRWAKHYEDTIVTRTVSGSAFLPTLYNILDWNSSYKYRIQGTYYNCDNMPIIIFNMKDAETLIPETILDENEKNAFVKPLSSIGKSIIGYPTEWINNFGYNFYTHAQKEEIENFIKNGIWDAGNEGQVFNNENIEKIPQKEDLRNYIHETMEEIERKHLYE